MMKQIMMTITMSNNRRSLLTRLVLLIVIGIGLSVASPALAARLSVSPATGVYSSGETFSVRVVVDTAGESINAADGTLSFSPNELSVVNVSKGSIFGLWTADPQFSNSAGTITFSGGTPQGYSGSAGTVLNITFRAKGSGSTRVQFSSGSVLAADGRGTNVLSNMSGGSYTISAVTEDPEPEAIIEYVPPDNTPAAPKITSATHPDPERWYAQKTAELAWTLPSDVTAVRTLLDKRPSSIPSKVYEDPISEITLEDLDEGEQYFHLQFQNADGWGSVTHYRLAVDTVPPRDLRLTIPEAADLSNPNQTIQVDVDEETSGVRRYIVQLDGGEPFEYIDETGSSTIELTDLTPGYHTAVVEAFDAAGNSTVGNLSFTISAFAKPQFTEYPAEINEDVIPVIKGTTKPQAEVTVTIEQVGVGRSKASAVETYTVMSNADGVFTVIPEGTFSLGVYELTAVATDERGAQSEPSDSVRMAVQRPGYLQLGSWAVSVLSVFVPLVALLGIAVVGVWYLILILRRTKRSVEREAGEAQQILTKEFDALQAELHKHRTELTNSRKTKKLTKTETQVLDALERSLQQSRQRVKKEISDVEDIVE